jgi:hypothetical protein
MTGWQMVAPALVLVAGTGARAAGGRAARFGIITDVHYADYQTVGTRFYRDSLPKVQEATQAIIASDADFMIELGDFKDTVCPGANKGTVPANCTDKTVGFIDTIDGAMAAFKKPRFHVLGNHDVDVLNQSIVLAHLKNYPQGVAVAAEGHYAFGMPFPRAAPTPSPPAPAGPDSAGCLFTDGGSNVWVRHADGTRDWIPSQFLPKGCQARATELTQDEIGAIPKRHGANSPLYPLSQKDAIAACTNDHGCLAAPPAKLKFIVLNGDYNENGTAWYDLDGSPTLPFVWDDAWVSTAQMEWLAEQLDAAKAAKQKVIVFVHYRLDGGPGGPVNCTAGTECGKTHNRAWVDDW